MPFAGARFIKS